MSLRRTPKRAASDELLLTGPFSAARSGLGYGQHAFDLLTQSKARASIGQARQQPGIKVLLYYNILIRTGICRKMGVSSGSDLSITSRGLQEIEYGNNDARIYTLYKIAARLGLALDKLLRF